MNYFNYLGYGEFQLKKNLPKDCITQCSSQGSVDCAVAYWLEKLDFNGDIDKTIQYLLSTGAWDIDDLQHYDTNRSRLLWLVCCELNERQNEGVSQ